MHSQEPLRLMLLIVGLSVLALVGLISLSLISSLRRCRRRRRKTGRIQKLRPRRIMPDLWQAAGDRLAQQLTRRHYDQADAPLADRPITPFEMPESPAEQDRDGESWKHGQPYEPRFEPPHAADDTPDDDDDENDDGDGDVPVPPAPHP